MGEKKLSFDRRFPLRFFSLATVVLTILWSAPVSAEKFRTDGEVLIYNTIKEGADGVSYEIDWDDVDRLEALLLENAEIRQLWLTSEGGLVGAAQEIADLVIDFELDTHVVEECSSACTVILLGGRNRTLQRGSKIGFHKSHWDAQSIREYYEYEKDHQFWETPFEFAEWLYEDTQREILDDLRYLLERGVAPGFAIKTLQADTDDMWFPRRRELLDAGVLTE